MVRSPLLRSAPFAACAALLAAPLALASIPAEPPGLVVATLERVNATAVAIPATGNITSTIVVSGADRSTWDVDVTTFVRHANADELQMTLTSPRGTVVTLTSNPFNDVTDEIPLANVINGTLWDDQANPAGQVPYVLNPGMGSDHAWVSGTLAQRLTPDEALGAFRGEDPNGTWTLTISDTFEFDPPVAPGTLDRWSLTVATLTPLPPFTPASGANNVVQAIATTGTPLISSTITIEGALGRLYDLDVRTFLPHTNSADIDMTLRSPAGTIVTLTTDTGAIFDNVFNGTTWDDQANPEGTVPYPLSLPGAFIGTNQGLATDHLHANNVVVPRLAPEEPLSAFTGESVNGTWTLTISDDREFGPSSGGQLTSWSLDFDLVGADGTVGGGLPTSATSVPTLSWIGIALLALVMLLVGTHRRGRTWIP